MHALRESASWKVLREQASMVQQQDMHALYKKVKTGVRVFLFWGKEGMPLGGWGPAGVWGTAADPACWGGA